MQDIDINGLQQQVLWSAFALSLVFGAIAQRTHFCTMGAVSDIVNIGDWSRMRMWALAIGVAMLGFAALSDQGQIDASKSLYASNRFMSVPTLHICPCLSRRRRTRPTSRLRQRVSSQLHRSHLERRCLY